MKPQIKTIIAAVIEEHVYGGDGKCMCGAAIGHSDGVAWTTYEEEHQANEIVRALERHGYIICNADEPLPVEGESDGGRYEIRERERANDEPIH